MRALLCVCALAGFQKRLHGLAQIGNGLVIKCIKAVNHRLGGHLICHDFL